MQTLQLPHPILDHQKNHRIMTVVAMTSLTSAQNTSILLCTPSGGDLHGNVIDFLLQHKLLMTNVVVENNPDLHFINSPEENITIEAVRELNQAVLLKPYSAETSVFVIFNIDLGSIAAQNALLKVVEEPPTYVQLILTTCTPSNVLTTILSRCRTEKITVLLPGNHQALETQSDTNFSEIYKQLQKKPTASEIFALSEKYKERADALQFIRNFIHWLHEANTISAAQKTTQLSALLHTEEILRKNVNVRLAIEDCFLNFSSTLV